ncbi:MarR family winged helix-turn-helix transcriptional regulator [Thioclava sp. GXIMD4215]|uniref:MarR family winged helix-turn-helix transcriptional regulator n=1 Tax=Thioclava sp. GXIMD4215 TaxID=3131928 RepID=UPI003250A6B8
MQNTHISTLTRQLHIALLDIMAVMNNPQVDEEMVRASGLNLDRALFALLVSVERFGPLGVVDLAERVGRDYTTVSRQVAKLDDLGLVERRGSAHDRRVREACITPNGQLMTDAVDAARARMAGEIFESWDEEEVGELVHLVQKLAKGMREVTGSTPFVTP